MKMEEDEIVAELRSLVRFPDKEEWEEKVEAVLRKMERMIYEEDYMLYPNCLQFFRRGEGIWMNRSDRDGYANYRALRTKSEGTGGRCSSEASIKKRWEGIRRPSGQRMRSVTGGETCRFF